MNKIKEHKYQILLVLCIVGIVVSSLMTFFPLGDLCGGEESGCIIVYKSGYGNIVGGHDNSRVGFIAFVALTAVLISHLYKPTKEKRLFIHAGILAAAILALYFIYLQFFVIGAICTYCMIVDIAMLAALVVLAYTWRD